MSRTGLPAKGFPIYAQGFPKLENAEVALLVRPMRKRETLLAGDPTGIHPHTSNQLIQQRPSAAGEPSTQLQEEAEFRSEAICEGWNTAFGR